MPFADRMERAFERADADQYMREAKEANAAAASRCPIAAALAQEIDLQATFCFDERQKLLSKAAAICHEAVLQGRDLPLVGLPPRAWNADQPEMPQDFSTAWDVAQVSMFARETA